MVRKRSLFEDGYLVTVKLTAGSVDMPYLKDQRSRSWRLETRVHV
jgi:hypothetical protein